MHFTSSARTVDLLGRQQIAGASTAISEIFKNAHDAYATTVRIDVVGNGQLLVVRDDGVGMSPAEFEYRWLTLAASKSVGPEQAEKPPAAQERPVLGAKGIGRLAVAIIGRNVAVITRAKGEDATVAFVPWRIFEVPGLTLDDVQIVTTQVPWARLGPAVLNDVLKRARSTLAELEATLLEREAGGDQIAKVHEVATSLADFDSSKAEDYLDPESVFLGSENGTAFLVFPVDNAEVLDLAQSTKPEDHQLVQDLLGFFLPSDLAAELSERRQSASSQESLSASDMVTSLVADENDLLSESEFFTVADLMLMDHQVVGTFDEDGYFRGQVSVYGSEPTLFELPWRTDAGALVGRRPKCGPFDFWTSALEGSVKDSELDRAEHARLTTKLEGLGGVYVFRNGVRVLPYGRPNFDWLGIEERRTKHLARNYFSHRRMFGAIIVDHPDSRLEEKAGREGFISNQAYRDLKDILTRFFRELAANFFVTGGQLAETWETTRDSMRDEYKNKKHAEQQAQIDRRREDLEAQIAAKYVDLGEELPSEVRRVLEHFKTALSDYESGDGSVEPAVAGATGLHRLLELESQYRLIVPPDLGLGSELERDIRTYDAMRSESFREHLEPAREQIYTQLSNRVPGLDYGSESVRDVERRAEFLTKKLADAVTNLENAIPGIEESALMLITEVKDAWVAERSQVIESTKSDVEEGGVTPADARRKAEAVLSSGAGHLVQAVDGYRSALLDVTWSRQGSTFFTTADADSREQARSLELQHAAIQTSPLVMRGMMLASLEHEFNQMIASLRRSVSRLSAIDLPDNRDMDAVESVQTTFEHLDGFLGILSPLRRTRATLPRKISGRQIRRFITAVFQERGLDEQAELKFADGFDDFRVIGHRAVWYPVMVNLVDNAMYWAARSEHDPVVEVGSSGETVWVEDNGPGVSAGDWDSIWEPQFSRKPGGTGLGLGISRNAIKDEGYTIELVSPPGGGARFEVKPEGESRG